MKFKELIATAQAGAPVIVECKSGVEDWEGCYPEVGMRMEVVGGRIDEPEVGRLEVDYTRFDEFNQRFESRNYFDAKGEPTRTAREAGYYHIKEHLYCDPESEIAEYLDIVSDERKSLIDAYAALAEPKPTYTAWIEGQLLSAAKIQAALEDRVCVHVDSSADGENLLVALSPAGVSESDVTELVKQAHQSSEAAGADLDQLSGELVKRDFVVFSRMLTIDV